MCNVVYLAMEERTAGSDTDLKMVDQSARQLATKLLCLSQFERQLLRSTQNLCPLCCNEENFQWHLSESSTKMYLKLLAQELASKMSVSDD